MTSRRGVRGVRLFRGWSFCDTSTYENDRGGRGKKNMGDVIYECAVYRQMHTSIRVKPFSGKKLSDSMNFI